MAPSLKSLPPSRVLVVFEAAGRLLNFSAAGRHLGVSQAAVSKQIQEFEANLGIKLFVRSNRGLTLTAAGRRLHQAVSFGLCHIADAMEEARPRFQAGRVTITTTIALASVWLMPRIAKFRADHPAIDLRVIATDAVLDLSGEGIDVGLRYGIGQWPGTMARKLFGIELFPVCSPGFLAAARPIQTVADLLKTTLLHVDEPNTSDADWGVWFRAVGLGHGAPPGGLRFNNYPLLVQAAVNGQGVALGWGHLVDDLLASGALVRCLPTTLRLSSAFYLVNADNVLLRGEVATFSDWMVRETSCLRD
ncbi:LysR substrate-binding domain-containing protein [Ancylobacter terrae]|uniref:LysR substrate-binding domain-containing protein n=1 Tax=Ancylobacter sp. sgz301288 TaxID=3342077 RepID=UPI0038592187